MTAIGQQRADERLARILAPHRRPAPLPTIGADVLAFLASHADYQFDPSGERIEGLLDRISEANLAIVCDLELSGQPKIGDFIALHTATAELLQLARRRIEVESEAGNEPFVYNATRKIRHTSAEELEAECPSWPGAEAQ